MIKPHANGNGLGRLHPKKIFQFFLQSTFDLRLISIRRRLQALREKFFVSLWFYAQRFFTGYFLQY